MQRLLLLILLFVIGTEAPAQSGYWQQELRYTIKAELSEADHSIRASESIVYKNHSPSTLQFIWFHLWPNAYSNDSTALIRQIKSDSSRSRKMENYGRGSIEGLSFTVNGSPAATEPHPNPDYVDIIKLLLNKPLAPGDSVIIATPFTVKLPPYFSRSGYADGEIMACQWYPKPAVFDKDGWHAIPYLDMGEFYSEYASFDVSITVPAGFIVGASGTLQNSDELQAYKKAGAANTADRKGKRTLYQPLNGNSSKTLRYLAEQVPDFAWFADRNFVIQYDTTRLPGGRIIDLFTFYHNKKGTIWNNSIDYVKEGVQYYSSRVGEYAYPVVQAVEGPANNSSGGMEYPMITLITSPDAKETTLASVIVHEVGHNWFMCMLGSNERKHTWMDEGLNTYYQFRYEAEKFRANSIFGDAIPDDLKKLPASEFQRVVYDVIAKNLPMESAMDIPADQYPNSDEYGLVSYVKTALWMYLLEAATSQEQVDKAVQAYFAKWKFRHPGPGDMKAAFEEALNTRLDQFFELTKKTGKLE